MPDLRHILFVDDEDSILGGLRDLLRRHRKKWRMTFALGGEEGLRALDQGDVDVVVSDMRMPRVDGAAVLRHAHDHYPGTVRIVLSGYSEVEATLRAVPVAHQFLSKPCDASQLEAVIERTCALQSLLGERDLRAELGKLDKLPSQPRVYHRILETLSDPEAGVGDVGRLVERDAAMTLKILQLVNSGFFGLPRQISDVRHAASLLGLRNLQNLVLTLEIFDASRYGARTEALQRHSLLTGQLASRIVADRDLSSDAFLAGVLHDVGFLALFHTQPERIGDILARAAAGELVLESERTTWGFTHSEVGAYLLGLWGLPYPVIEAVMHHHVPGRIPALGGRELVAAVHVADALVHDHAPPFPGLPDGTTLDLEFVAEVGQLERLDEWRALAASLAGEEPPG